MPAIVSSRTRRLYHRPPSGPVCLNRGSMQANGLVAWWPLIDGTRDLKDYSGYGNTMSLSGAPVTVPGLDGGFAVDFSGSAQSLTRSGVAAAALPLTMACWFNSDVVNAADGLMTLYSSSNFSHHCLIAAGTTAGDPVQAQSFTDGGGTGTASSTTGYTASRWYHACGVWTATDSRAAFIDGRSKGTNATSSSPSSLNTTRIANGGAVSPGLFAGLIQHACIWNRDLSDAEVYALYDPPTRWDLYYPLGRVTYGFVFGGGGGAGFLAYPRPRGLDGGMSVLRGGMQ